MVEPIKVVIMKRDGLSSEEADEMIAEARAELMMLIDDNGTYMEACDVVEQNFGLEPDYLEELLPLY